MFPLGPGIQHSQVMSPTDTAMVLRRRARSMGADGGGRELAALTNAADVPVPTGAL